jgi:hypothetical protein
VLITDHRKAQLFRIVHHGSNNNENIKWQEFTVPINLFLSAHFQAHDIAVNA